MYELLEKAGQATPIADNAAGTPLTFRSRGGLIFGVINVRALSPCTLIAQVIGNFATVYLDQAYWQRAVASRPKTAVKAYMLAGFAWLPVPFCLVRLDLARASLTDPGHDARPLRLCPQRPVPTDARRLPDLARPRRADCRGRDRWLGWRRRHASAPLPRGHLGDLRGAHRRVEPARVRLVFAMCAITSCSRADRGRCQSQGHRSPHPHRAAHLGVRLGPLHGRAGRHLLLCVDSPPC